MWSLLTAVLLAATPEASPFDAGAAARFARLALDCVGREYPNKIAHVLAGDEDVQPPRRLTPAFFGCYDWHSAVHGHWLLARLVRSFPDAPFAPAARAALSRSLTAEYVAGELAYLRGPGRVAFERPYGLAWLLQLGAEAREGSDAGSRAWAGALAPLEAEAALRFRQWLPKLTRPIRVGEHDQTAFALGLVLDWTSVSGDATTRELVLGRARDFYLADRDCPLAYEPSGQDFLSPCLAEADLVRRLLPPGSFATWLSTFLPSLPREGSAVWLPPAVVTDPTDPKLAHLDGLNLSRAWMLEGIASALPASSRRRGGLLELAARHRAAGLAAVTSERYEGAHWLGSFATYLMTGHGLSEPLAAAPEPVQ